MDGVHACPTLTHQIETSCLCKVGRWWPTRCVSPGGAEGDAHSLPFMFPEKRAPVNCTFGRERCGISSCFVSLRIGFLVWKESRFDCWTLAKELSGGLLWPPSLSFSLSLEPPLSSSFPLTSAHLQEGRSLTSLPHLKFWEINLIRRLMGKPIKAVQSRLYYYLNWTPYVLFPYIYFFLIWKGKNGVTVMHFQSANTLV